MVGHKDVVRYTPCGHTQHDQRDEHPHVRFGHVKHNRQDKLDGH